MESHVSWLRRQGPCCCLEAAQRPMWSRSQSCLEQAAQQPMGSCSKRTHPVLLHHHRATVQYGANVQRAHPSLRGDHTLVRGLSGSQRVRAVDPLGPLAPRHGRMTVNPSLRVGHALVRGRAEASMRDRAATPKGFEQRTYLGPLPPRHGRVTFSPALRGGHTLERCCEAPSSQGRAATASNPLAQQPC